jgi:hypothetical protein
MKTLLLVSAVVSVGRVLAAAGDSVPPWAQYGILGLVVLGLVYTKTIVPGWIYQETRGELVDSRVEVKALTQQIIENQQIALPALQTATQVVQQALPLVQDALRLRDQRGGGG